MLAIIEPKMELFPEFIIPQLFGLVITIIGGVYIYLKYVTFNYWNSKNIVHVKPVVPVGNLWPVLLQKISLGELIRDKYLEFKQHPVFGFYSVHKPALVINDPELIRSVLTKEFSCFHDRGFFFNEKVDPLSANIWALPGIRWRRVRTQFSPMFTSSKMKQMFFRIKECSETLAACVATSVEGSRLIDINELMARYSTDVIESVAFGIQCNSLQNSNDEFRKYGRKVFDPKPIRNTLAYLAPHVLKMFNISLTDPGVSKFIINVVKETIEYRTTNNVVRRDMMDLIMQLVNEGFIKENNDEAAASVSESDYEKITMIEGAAQAFMFWQAGFETAATTATHCLFELALHEDIQDKVAAEINTVLEEFGGLTYESVKKMHYLHKVVSETMRKYPALPFLNRICTRDIDLPGINLRVGKATSILIPVLGLHWDPDIYPEPDEFNPERFTEDNIAGRHQYAYLPFGEGPRNCIGMMFGLMQTKVGLLSLLSKYRFKPGPNLTVPIKLEKGSLVTSAVGEVELEIAQRQMTTLD